MPIRGHKFVSGFIPKSANKATNDFDGQIMTNYVNHQIIEITKFLESSKENIEIRNKPITENVN